MKPCIKIYSLKTLYLFGILISNQVFADKIINVTSFSFSPSAETITLGEKITFNFISGFHNAATTSIPNGASAYTSDALSTNVRSVDFAPSVAGAYSFVCQAHPSMTFSLTVNPPLAINISSSSSNTFCIGNTISFTHTLTGTFAGGNVFNVELSNNLGSFSSPTTILPTISGANVQFTLPTISSGTGYRFRLVSSNPIIQSNNNGTDLSLNVTGNPVANIVSNAAGSICVNTPVTITANSLNISGNINYGWKINNSVVGTNSNQLSTNTLADGDNIICTITAQPSGCSSSVVTVASNTIVTTVLSAVVPSISITGFRNYPQNCSESVTTISANISGGGTSPNITWTIINSFWGRTTIGSNFNTTTLSMFGGTVQANLTSSLSCANPSSVTSNVLVFENLPIPLGELFVALTSTGTTIFTYGSTNPPILNWYYNGSIILTTSTSINSTLSGLYSVKYSNYGCPAYSQDYNFQYNPTSVISLTEEKSKITMYPNPAKEKLLIASSGGIKKSGLKIFIYDVGNKIVLNSTFYEGICEGGKGKDCLCPGTSEIDISSLQNGIYFVRILDAKKTIFSGKLLKE